MAKDAVGPRDHMERKIGLLFKMSRLMVILLEYKNHAVCGRNRIGHILDNRRLLNWLRKQFNS